jgi:hypothetical protein
LEHPRFGELAVAAALQVVEEERELDLLAIVLRRFGGEVDVAQPVAVPEPRPVEQPASERERIFAWRRL